MQVHGAAAAFEALKDILDKRKMDNFYLYHSLLGGINSRLNNVIEAKVNYENAISFTKSDTEKKLLMEKINSLLN